MYGFPMGLRGVTPFAGGCRQLLQFLGQLMHPPWSSVVRGAGKTVGRPIPRAQPELVSGLGPADRAL